MSAILGIDVKKLTDTAKIPTYATDGSGAFDIYSDEKVHVGSAPHMIHTGIAVAIPKGWMMIIIPRSSIGAKTGLRMPHSAGLIDSDYRGEVKILYETKTGAPWEWPTGEYIQKGDRIAQGYLLPVVKADFMVVDELDETDRGEGGFGSTGV